MTLCVIGNDLGERSFVLHAILHGVIKEIHEVVNHPVVAAREMIVSTDTGRQFLTDM